MAHRADRRVAGAEMNIMRIDRLNKSFGSLTVTDDVTLAVGEGERHAIIGPNGAGKTSLNNQVGGQLKPTSGSILLRDRDITGASPDRISRMGVARTFQRNNLFQNLSVTENIRLALQIRHGKPLDFFTPVADNRALSERASALTARVHLASNSAAGPGIVIWRATTRNRRRSCRRPCAFAVGRADLGDVAKRDGPNHRIDCRAAARGLNPHGRARHESGVRGRRPHYRSLIWKSSGHRHPG